MHEGLPRLVKVFPTVSHPTGHTKTLPQGASGYIHKLLPLKCTHHKCTQQTVIKNIWYTICDP